MVYKYSSGAFRYFAKNTNKSPPPLQNSHINVNEKYGRHLTYQHINPITTIVEEKARSANVSDIKILRVYQFGGCYFPSEAISGYKNVLHLEIQGFVENTMKVFSLAPKLPKLDTLHFGQSAICHFDKNVKEPIDENECNETVKNSVKHLTMKIDMTKYDKAQPTDQEWISGRIQMILKQVCQYCPDLQTAELTIPNQVDRSFFYAKFPHIAKQPQHKAFAAAAAMQANVGQQHEPTPNHGQLAKHQQQQAPNHGQLAKQHQQQTPNHGQLAKQHQQTPNHGQLAKHQQQTPNHGQLAKQHQQTPNHGQLAKQHQQQAPNHGQLAKQHQQQTPNHGQLAKQHQQQTPNQGQLAKQHQQQTPNHGQLPKQQQQQTSNHGQQQPVERMQKTNQPAKRSKRAMEVLPQTQSDTEELSERESNGNAPPKKKIVCIDLTEEDDNAFGNENTILVKEYHLMLVQTKRNNKDNSDNGARWG